MSEIYDGKVVIIVSNGEVADVLNLPDGFGWFQVRLDVDLGVMLTRPDNGEAIAWLESLLDSSNIVVFMDGFAVRKVFRLDGVDCVVVDLDGADVGECPYCKVGDFCPEDDGVCRICGFDISEFEQFV
jgi:hypothetical protein